MTGSNGPGLPPIEVQRALFDADTTVDKPCPVPGCGAIRLPGQDQVVTCAHDLNPEPRRRPAACLNAHDPHTAPFPPGY